jgi:hypothetical protein
MLETREEYFVKRRAFPDSDASRFTNDETHISSTLRLSSVEG